MHTKRMNKQQIKSQTTSMTKTKVPTNMTKTKIPASMIKINHNE